MIPRTRHYKVIILLVKYHNMYLCVQGQTQSVFHIWSKTQLHSCFDAERQLRVNFLLTLQECNMETVQSNIYL